jgi:hypothetical protein
MYNRATAYSKSKGSKQPSSKLPQHPEGCKDEDCLLSSGPWVRIPPGTQLKLKEQLLKKSLRLE